MTLIDIFNQSCKKFATHKALTKRMGYRTVSLTYQDVYELSYRIAFLLEKQGVKKGDKVLIIGQNSPYLCSLMWGCLLQGAIMVPLNIQSTYEMVQSVVDQVAPKILFKDRFFRFNDDDGLPTFIIEMLDESTQDNNNEKVTFHSAQPDDCIEILYTSGTTGNPKGVVLTHENICENLKSIESVIKFKIENERLLSILPLSHIFEQTVGFFFAFKSGAHVIYPHSRLEIRNLIKNYRVTKLLVVPEFLKVFWSAIKDDVIKQGKEEQFERLLRFSFRMRKQWLSRLLFYKIHKIFGGKLYDIAAGGAPLDPELERQWLSLGFSIMQGYGLTETSPVVTFNAPDNHRFGSVGTPLPGVSIKVAYDGEILAKGKNVFKEYFNDPEKTKKTFTHDGWFKTGDMGSIDQDGFLFLKGRKKYMILGPGGQNVFPEDIELILDEMEEVEQSCVIGLTRPNGAVEIHAALLFAQEGVDGNEIIRNANSKLSSYQQIGGWTQWPERQFPQTLTRKIKKNQVEAIILSLQDSTKKESLTSSTQLIIVLARMTGLDPARIKRDSMIINDLNMDSLLRIELLLRLEQDFGVIIDESKITEQTTVADLQTMIDNKENMPTPPPLKKWPRSWLACVARLIGQSAILLISRLFMKLEIQGLENLQDLKGPVIFMPNHLSYFDPFVLIKALPLRLRFKLSFAAARNVLYEDFKKFALPGEFLCNAFPFPRQDHEHTKLGLEYMGQLLDENFSVVLFPEGKISEDGKLLPFKGGAGLVAIEMGVPVVPIKIVGIEHIFPYDCMAPKKTGSVKLIFGAPLKFKKDYSYNDATIEIQNALKKL